MENTQLIDNFKRGLAHVGLKYTPQRKLIFMTLLENGALTNAEIAKLVAGNVDRATVYRTLEAFEKMHLINRIWNGWKSKIELSDLFITHHHHATCEKCGNVLRLESEKLEKALRMVANELPFTMKDHTVELRGLCESCAAHRPS